MSDKSLLKLCTFNIRLDCGNDGAYNWDQRRDRVFNWIRETQPDVIGFQEVLPHVKDELEAALPAYNFVGVGRDKPNEDEANPVAYRRDRFDLRGAHTFWLSPTPEVSGSRDPQGSGLPRICTVAVLRLKENGKLLRFYNTHLDHVNEPARVNGIRTIFSYMKRYETELPLPSVIVGDFNARPGGEAMTAFHDEQPIQLVDCSTLEGCEKQTTYHGYGQADGIKIDYIYATENCSLERFTLVDESLTGDFLTDHYPLLAEISF